MTPKPGGFKKALKKIFKACENDSKFVKVFKPGPDGSICYSSEVRWRRFGTKRILYLNSDATNATIKRIVNAYGPNKQYAVTDIAGKEGTKEDIVAFLKEAWDEAVKK